MKTLLTNEAAVLQADNEGPGQQPPQQVPRLNTVQTGIFANLSAATANRAAAARRNTNLSYLQRQAIANLELERYMGCDGIDVVAQDEDGNIVYPNPLEWWKRKEREFPLLAKLAKRFLCIPATSAPAERLFSHAGLIISKARAALKPENAAAIVFLHDSWELTEDYLNNA